MPKIENDGTRRVILGVAKGAGKPLVFGTSADKDVPASKRLGTQHTVSAEQAKAIEANPVVAAMGSKLGLRVK